MRGVFLLAVLLSTASSVAALPSGISGEYGDIEYWIDPDGSRPLIGLRYGEVQSVEAGMGACTADPCYIPFIFLDGLTGNQSVIAGAACIDNANFDCAFLVVHISPNGEQTGAFCTTGPDGKAEILCAALLDPYGHAVYVDAENTTVCERSLTYDENLGYPPTTQRCASVEVLEDGVAVGICSGPQQSPWDDPVSECAQTVVQSNGDGTCARRIGPAGDVNEVHCVPPIICAYNPAALTNFCLTLDSDEQDVEYPAPTADPTYDLDGGICIVGFLCGPTADPGIAVGTDTATVPTTVPIGYLELTALCETIPESCRLDIGPLQRP